MTDNRGHPSINRLIDSKNNHRSALSDIDRVESRLIVCQSDIIANIDTCLLSILVKVRNGEGNEIGTLLASLAKYVQALRRSMGP